MREESIFKGTIALDKTRDKYLRKSVRGFFKKGASNPVMYVEKDNNIKNT